VRTAFERDYVVVRIDIERMQGGAELAGELRGERDGGIPWMVILDADGAARITSDGPEGNCGCPARPHEVDHFLAMVDATREHMSDEERAILERELRAFAAGLLAGLEERPGSAQYSAARVHVLKGRFTEALESLEAAAKAGFGIEEALSDPALHLLRTDPDRRLELKQLLERHTGAHHVTMVDPYEPGRRIRLAGRVVDADSGAPLGGARVYLFHTDAHGEYRPGVDAGGGAGNPRLFAFVVGDADGAFTVDTILPERYPDTTIPRHVHYEVTAEGRAPFTGQCYFAEDPNLGDSARRAAEERGTPVVAFERGAEMRSVGQLEIRVPAR